MQFPEMHTHEVDIRIVNIKQGDGVFHSIHTSRPGPMERVFELVAAHIRLGCYELVSLNLGGFINRKAHCIVVISTSFTSTELRAKGFEFHGLDDESSPAPVVPREDLEPREDAATWVRLDFTNVHWKSPFHVIRGAMYGPAERAILCIDAHLKQGLYRLESVHVGKQWCSICIETALSREELRAGGFKWHGLPVAEGEEDAGAIVMPGHSRAGDFWTDDAGVRRTDFVELRDL